ncbi:MAG: hypothetical protein RBU30_16120 [Polyangia bacterium]|jgi:predicted NUDIX family phosphoesterase|nr:hypothetical protein [Polyangia bacterium]
MEFVYVVHRRDLFDLAYPHGFVGRGGREGQPSLETYLERIAARGFFVERPWAERNSTVKQIIPYTLVVHGQTLFMVLRLPAGGEKRLFGKRSIGIGGHINPEDGAEDRGALASRCALRELGEELAIEGPVTLEPVGVINDDSNPVGAVHFGLVQVARLDAPTARVREQDTLEGGFHPIGELQKLLADPEANFETWSSLILEQIDSVLAG